MFFSVNIELGI